MFFTMKKNNLFVKISLYSCTYLALKCRQVIHITLQQFIELRRSQQIIRVTVCDYCFRSYSRYVFNLNNNSFLCSTLQLAQKDILEQTVPGYVHQAVNLTHVVTWTGGVFVPQVRLLIIVPQVIIPESMLFSNFVIV